MHCKHDTFYEGIQRDLSIIHNIEWFCLKFILDLVLLHSLIGATSCGLSSRLMEDINDRYPSIDMVSVSIIPFSSGESSFQFCNSMLTLNSLYRFVLFCIQNLKIKQQTISVNFVN